MTTQLAEIERLSRLYSALSQISQAIVWKRTRAELFSTVCDVLVRSGGFGMAWVGWYDPETSRLLPVSHAGDEGGYLGSTQVYADDRPEGRGPSGRAFRENRAYVCNDLFADPATLPWRSELERRGFHAAAAFPIRLSDAPSGTLSVYSDRSGFFQDKEMALLDQAATDISFALDNLQRDDARRQAEEAIQRLVAIVESTDDAIVSKTLEGTITSWNPAAERMFGYRAAEVVGRSAALLLPAERAAEERQILARIERGESVRQFETLRQRKGGVLFPVSITVSPIWGADEELAGGAKVMGMSKIVRDITERKQAEALAEAEQRFTGGLIEAMPGIFYLYDAQGRFLRWNRNFERISGYSAEEISCMRPLDFFGEESRPLLQQRIAEVFEKGEATVEAPFLSKQGKAIPCFFTGKRILFEGMPCLVGVGVDITERKRVEAALSKSEARYRSTLDNILESCQILGFDWRYLYLNPAAAVQNRRPNSELFGRCMPEMWPGIENTGVFKMLQRCLQQRVPVHEEIEFVFADGAAGWFDVRAQPVPEGIFVLSIDISERKQAENALRELNERLELKVAERTRDLEAARVRAESADRIKSAFLATMSHELRTPLNSIIGFTGIVLKGLAGALNLEQAKQLGMVQSSARHLLDLINDVLDISKIEAGQMEVRRAPFDVAASIQRVALSVQPLVDKKGLTLGCELGALPSALSSDQRRVEQILLNLLNNAIKFTDRGGVTLRAEVIEDTTRAATTESPRQALHLRVSDTGIGMKSEDLTQLFQPFRQIDSGLQRQHEGTGLGLAICRKLAELLGGQVRAESVWGSGSVFSVILPMSTDAAP